MNKTEKIYIAGPMRGYENYNFPAFDAAEALLRSRCWIPINPAAMDRIQEGWDKYPPEDWKPSPAFNQRVMRRDLDALFGCYAIYMLTGWVASEGAQVELALALYLGLSVFYEKKDM